MQQLIGSDKESIFELETLFYEYLSTLRDYYMKEFTIRSKKIKNMEGLSQQKRIILRECEAAMRTAVPASQVHEWSFLVYVWFFGLHSLQSHVYSR